MKSGRFHVKSSGFHEIHLKNLINQMNSNKNSSVLCSAVGRLMSLDSHEIRWISQNPPNFMNMSFCVITKYRSFFRKTNNATVTFKTN